eukprot:TRINITY_DN1921_c1_g2_i2.p1 TRINITY_DN1921_c1_g2~~TRINITY_DN1921_c1_g2_i2.p1  ORF type:complete len:337 (-),score=52.03 TRINITY_DN1921_c1_g2_i2:655-1557(-)
MCKAGLAHEATPRAAFRSVVGRSKNTTGGTAQTSTYVGDAAISAADKLNISNPIQRGVVTNWDDMETLWQHIFADELRTSADEHAVVLCEAMLTTDADRQRMGQMVFEKFNARAVYFNAKPVLSLYASGRTDGCVVQSGDGVTHTVPVADGVVVKAGIKRLNMGGRDLTTYLSNILVERGYRFTSAADLEAYATWRRGWRTSRSTSPARSSEPHRTAPASRRATRCPTEGSSPSVTSASAAPSPSSALPSWARRAPAYTRPPSTASQPATPACAENCTGTSCWPAATPCAAASPSAWSRR